MDKKLQEHKNEKKKEHLLRLEDIIENNSFKSVDSLQHFFKDEKNDNDEQDKD